MIRIEGLELAAGAFTLSIEELAVQKGEFLVILGPTGSGKTVLLETLAGLRKPRAGAIWFDGREVTALPPERRGVGFVYQDYALFPHLTVAENIAFGLRARGRDARVRRHGGQVARDGERRVAGSTSGSHGDEGDHGPLSTRRGAWSTRVRETAALLGIESLLARYPAGLSGGEQQRVALARALAIDPEVLLLDEPLSALDRQTRQELRTEIKRLSTAVGATVVHVTHDLDEGLELGDKMAVLIDGELRQSGPPAQVTRFPHDTQVAGLLGCPNVLPVGEVPLELLLGATGEGDHVVIRPDEVGISLDGNVPAGLIVGAPAVVPTGDGGEGQNVTAERAPRERGVVTLFGTVRSIRAHSSYAAVDVEVPPLLTVYLLNPDVAGRGLRPGVRVRLAIPAPAMHRCGDGR